ncbi:AI-2E family transporter [Acetobacter persici]|uniref:AI-2E family transporter n=1 Tax=Acetobacter persici TaxID=1076596 RepID=UPI001F435B2C|nr:AI-2E family transporter [Acetobacter persici]MCG0996743.1 AI-2E family transporter [Acetobacter persici]
MMDGLTLTTERIMLALLLGGIAYGCVIVLAPFSSAILWAGVLTYATWPVFQHLRRRMSALAASLVMTFLCAVGFVIPLAFLASTTIAASPRWASRLNALFSFSHQIPPPPVWLTSLPMVGQDFASQWQHWSHDFDHLGASLRPYAGDIIQSLLVLFMQVANGALHLVMALFIAFFFWLSGSSLGDTLKAVITRIAGPHAGRHLHIIGGTVRGTVYGILGTAIIQGILTGVGFWLTGLSEPVMFGVLAAFLAVLPIGAPLVWVPASLWLMAEHHVGKGVLLLLYGILLISGADHIIRPLFIARGSKLPYLLTVLGVIGGVMAFGGLGIFLGPILLAVGFTLTVEFAAQQPSSHSSDDQRRLPS